MQGIYALRQIVEPRKEAIEECMQQVQQTIEQCATDLQAVREQLERLHAKITAPVE